MKYTAVVVGAGPAGSTAAKILAQEGVKVLIIDKDMFPRDKPCGGGLPSWVTTKFRYLTEIESIESVSYGGYIYTPSSKLPLLLHKSEPVTSMVLRKKFDAKLLQLATENGASNLSGHKVTNIKIQNQNQQITLINGTSLQADIIIGADGVNSIVAQQTGLFTKRNYRGISVVEEFKINENIIDDFFSQQKYCYIFIKPFGISGYGWVFPKKNHINIGIGEIQNLTQSHSHKKNLKNIYLKYLHLLKDKNVIPNNLTSIKLRGGITPIQHHNKTYTDHVLLCGDAAGFINPISGEGIYYALYSGQLAAKIALKAIEHEDFTSAFLSQYQEAWKKDFGKDLAFLAKSIPRWEKPNTRIINLIGKDQKLAELMFNIFIGQESIHENRWKLLQRLIIAAVKSRLR